MESFRNKTAIITGAGQGIGLAIATGLAARGCRVVINDIDADALSAAAREITSKGGTCLTLAGDAGDVRFIRSMVSEAVHRFGGIDICIANAGVTLFGNFLDYEPDDFDKVMGLNLRGSFFLAQATARQMIARQSGGRILFMSSVTGHQAHKDLAAYGMSKAALEMLAKSLVVELSPYGITVNAIAPGATITSRTTSDPDYINTWSRITPMGRPATTDDITHAALFLVSPESGHVTGQTLIIDGGWTSVSPPPS